MTTDDASAALTKFAGLGNAVGTILNGQSLDVPATLRSHGHKAAKHGLHAAKGRLHPPSYRHSLSSHRHHLGKRERSGHATAQISADDASVAMGTAFQTAVTTEVTR